jgi:hypothetical protein
VDILTSYYEKLLPEDETRGSIGNAAQTMWPLLSKEEQAEWEQLADAVKILYLRIFELDEKNRQYFQSARQQVAAEEISLLIKNLEYAAAMSFRHGKSNVKGE